MMEPLDLMRQAAQDSWERLLGYGWQLDIGTYYGPLTETLTWTRALAEALGRGEEPIYSGLAYARNCLLHGKSIVSEVWVEGPWEPRRTKGGCRVGGGSATSYAWAFTTTDPDPEAMTPKRRADYLEHVAQWEVFQRLSSPLHELGLDMDAAPPLLPRRDGRIPKPNSFIIGT
jgi:hypothetical protein